LCPDNIFQFEKRKKEFGKISALVLTKLARPNLLDWASEVKIPDIHGGVTKEFGPRHLPI